MNHDIMSLDIAPKGCSPDVDMGYGYHLALLEQLRREVVHGFLDSHTRASKNAGKALEIASFCYALIELLKEKGIISFEELDGRQEVVRKRLAKKFAEQGMGVVALQDFKENKYEFGEEVEIDCESQMQYCLATCCRFDFALSRQDIEEGVIKWDLGRPYMVARDGDGYCRHFDRSTFRCRVWRQRPIPCRGYDCRKDDRVWKSYKKKIISPKLQNLF